MVLVVLVPVLVIVRFRPPLSSCCYCPDLPLRVSTSDLTLSPRLVVIFLVRRRKVTREKCARLGASFDDWTCTMTIRVLPRVVTGNLVGTFRNPSCLCRVYSLSLTHTHTYSLSPSVSLVLSLSTPSLFLSLFLYNHLALPFSQTGVVNMRSAETSMEWRRESRLEIISINRILRALLHYHNAHY